MADLCTLCGGVISPPHGFAPARCFGCGAAYFSQTMIDMKWVKERIHFLESEVKRLKEGIQSRQKQRVKEIRAYVEALQQRDFEQMRGIASKVDASTASELLDIIDSYEAIKKE